MTNTTKLSSPYLALRILIRLSQESPTVFLPANLAAMKSNLDEMEDLGWIRVGTARYAPKVSITAAGQDHLDAVLADAAAALEYRSTWTPIS